MKLGMEGHGGGGGEGQNRGGASTFMQDFEFQTTGVSTLREVLPSKANSSSLWPGARVQISSMKATSLQLTHFHFSSVVFFMCVFEIYHQCLKRNLKI